MNQPATSLAQLAAMVLAATTLSCLPTDPATNAPPSIQTIAGRTVFVGEPIDFRVSATDPDNDPVTFLFSGDSHGATIGASSGCFSWRPVLADTGAVSITIRVSDGANAVTATAAFTVVMPTLGENEAIRFFRPAGGETYTYGDTLTVVFAVKWCAWQAFMQLDIPGSDPCAFAPSVEYGPVRDSDDSTDVEGRVCRFVRRFEDRMMWIGYYRLPLVDKQYSAGCSTAFGGGTAHVDSIRIFAKDPYVDQRGPVGCASTIETGVPVMFALLNGAYSGTFGVAP